MTDDSQQQPDKLEKSLGDQATGADVSRAEQELSLGDQATSGDALSSLSDLGSGLGEAMDADLPLIDLAARYQIEGELGQGGMGAVLLATDRQLKRKVAIKRILGSLTQSKTALQRFVTEAQSIAALNHFNIVQVYEFGRDAEGPLLVLEFVEGGSLLEKLKKGKLEVEEAVDITCQLCDALGKAHGAGIIHRDIKPANILLTEDGQPKLTDFGLARQDMTDHGQTQAGAVLGTIDFMSPEQRRDATATDARSDLWSLAATLYQMITGSSPKVIRLDQLPENLASVIGKMLEENPDKRYASAEEFKAELRKGLATVATTISADLVAGVCPACSATNELSRKFCRGCGDPLEVRCLSCDQEMPVWESFCGACGCSQQKERERIRQKLLDMIETSLTFSREHDYEQAFSQMRRVQEDLHTFTEDIRQQAAKQIELMTAQQIEQHRLRDQLVELASDRQQNYDYAAAVQLFEKIPAPLRTDNNIATQLLAVQSSRREIATLERAIRDRLKNKQLDKLWVSVKRWLELKPNDPQVQKLMKQLLQHQQRNRLQKLKRGIAAKLTVAEKFKLIKDYLALYPNEEEAKQLHEDIRRQAMSDHLDSEQAEKKRRRLILGGIGGMIVLIIILIISNNL